MTRLPNFLIIGTGKAGTTSLYRYLNQHPEIYLSPVKETNYFAFRGQQVDFRGPGDADKINRTSITNWDNYQAQFATVQNETAIGEVSPLYLFFPLAPARIKETLPTAKLIAILRNPVDRAYSSYLHLRRDKREPLPTFKDALEAEAQRIEAGWGPIWYYKTLGFYYPQLKRYYDLFPPEQIKIYLYDEFKQNLVAVVQDIFDYLGVDPAFCPDTAVRHNVSGLPKSQDLHRFLTKPHIIKSMVQPLLPVAVQKKVKRIFSHLRNGNLEKLQLPPSLREALLVDLYQNDILATEQLIKRDLSNWLI